VNIFLRAKNENHKKRKRGRSTHTIDPSTFGGDVDHLHFHDRPDVFGASLHGHSPYRHGLSFFEFALNEKPEIL
jgi:hypothetical protein